MPSGVWADRIIRACLHFPSKGRGIQKSAIALAVISIACVYSSGWGQAPSAAAGGPSAGTTSTARSVQQAYAKGLRAEGEGDWETAFDAYRQAATLSPNDRNIELHAQFARSALAQMRTGRGRTAGDRRQLLAGSRHAAIGFGSGSDLHRGTGASAATRESDRPGNFAKRYFGQTSNRAFPHSEAGRRHARISTLKW